MTSIWKVSAPRMPTSLETSTPASDTRFRRGVRIHHGWRCIQRLSRRSNDIVVTSIRYMYEQRRLYTTKKIFPERAVGPANELPVLVSEMTRPCRQLDMAETARLLPDYCKSRLARLSLSLCAQIEICPLSRRSARFILIVLKNMTSAKLRYATHPSPPTSARPRSDARTNSPYESQRGRHSNLLEYRTRLPYLAGMTGVPCRGWT